MLNPIDPTASGPRVRAIRMETSHAERAAEPGAPQQQQGLAAQILARHALRFYPTGTPETGREFA
jgi:hypothetical protein